MQITLDHVHEYVSAVWNGETRRSHDGNDSKQWSLHDYADEYGEPGYRSDGPILFGDWWIRGLRGAVDEHGRPELTHFERVYPRLTAKLEELGVEFEWYDEWHVDSSTSPVKAWRTVEDSYHWKSSIVWPQDSSEPITPDDDISVWLEWATNNTRACISDANVAGIDSKLEELGFERRPVDGSYANGWHPGQTDDPVKIDAELRGRHGPDIEVVFTLDEVSQFYIRFAAWWRDPNAEENDDDE